MTSHRHLLRRLWPVIPLFVASLLVLTGCSGSPAPSAGPATAAPEGAFPATVAHRYGETVVPGQPERVVSLGYTDQDPILALGTVPVATREFTGNRPGATWPWAADRLGGEQPEVLPLAEVNPEAVAALRPDLIVAISAALTREQYDQYSRIAPTIVAPEGTVDYGTPWQDTTRMVGTALGVRAEADGLVTSVEARFREAAEEHPELAGATVVAARPSTVDNASFFAWSSRDQRGRFLTDLGMQIPARIDQAAGDQFYATVSTEQIATLDDADALVVVGTDAERAAFEALPGYAQLRLVQESKVVSLDEEASAALSFGTVLSLPAVLDDLPGRLAEAVGR